MGNISTKKIYTKENINLINNNSNYNELLYNFKGHLNINKKYIDYVNVLFYEDYLIIKSNKYNETISYYDILLWKSPKNINNSKNSKDFWEFNRTNNTVYHFIIDFNSSTIGKNLLTIINNHINYVKQQ